MAAKEVEQSPTSTQSAQNGEKEKLHPIESCSSLSYWTVQWVSPLLRLGSRQPLELSDVYDLPRAMRAKPLGDKFLAALEKKKGKRRVAKALFSANGYHYGIGMMFAPLQVGCQAALPLLLKYLIRYLSSEALYKKDPLWGIESGWALAGMLCVCSLGGVAGMNAMFMNMTFFGVNNRTAIMQVLYRKVLRLSEASLQQTSLGQIVTLASADLERVFLGGLQSMMLMTAPVLVILCISLLVLEVGPLPTACGFSVVAFVLPLNVFVAKQMGTRKRRMLELTDARVRFMTDILRGMRLVKLYAWEKSVESHIQDLRIKEVRENTICVQLMAFTQSTGYILPALIPFFMFISYSALGNDLTMDKVFAILALMNVIRMPMQMIPRAINGVMQALVSLQRIEVFLSIPDRAVGWEALKGASEAQGDGVDGKRPDVNLQNVQCCWGGEAEAKALEELKRTAPKKGKGKGKGAGKGKDEGNGEGKGEAGKGSGKGEGKSNGHTNGEEKGKSNGKGEEAGVSKSNGNGEEKAGDKAAPESNGQAPARQRSSSTTLCIAGVTLVIPPGQKVAIVGRVASGKTSLLYSILGELEVKAGTIARSTPTVPYCSQSAWIQSATLKENILFGIDEDPELYGVAIEAAQLLPDLDILPNGDLTSIGENGINLSGGQKARAALARAFYSCLKRHSPLVLLDDPLAAVDAFVAHALFYKGFLGILKEQTIVLTLNAHLDLLSKFDRVISLSDGLISADGSLADVMAAEPWIRDAVGTNTSPEKGLVTFELTGPLGISLDLTTGVVGRVFPAGQGAKLGVETGWEIQSLDDIPFSVKVLDDKIGSGSQYKITFVKKVAEAEPEEKLEAAEADPEDKKTKTVGARNSLVQLAETEEKEKKNLISRPLYEPEDRVTGRVQWHNYVEWARCAVSEDSGSRSGFCILALLGVVFGACQTFRMALDIWCARWGKERMAMEDAVPVYGGLAAGFMVAVFLRAATFLLIAMRACRALHQKVLQKVLMAPVNLFFDVTQSGSILNRFSGDLEKVDDKLPEQFYNFLNLIVIVFGALLLCLASSPFVVCGYPILIYFFYKIVSFYQKSAREIKRLDAISKSPVLQHFSESIKGLVTIRAYDSGKAFCLKYDELVNKHSKTFFTFWISSRWLAMRVDSIATALQSFVALVSIAWKDNIDPVMVGIALVWGFQLSGLLQFCVRSFAEVENTMTGVERLVAYQHVPQEAAHVMEPRPPKNWPKGQIELRDICARYRPNLPLVLRNVSMTIEAGERVGICGRTGSGKSTMLLILFRIVEVEQGQVFIDGQDTRTIGLRDLRQRIAIIPQDPVLFRMQVRRNLDPFSMYSDEQIWTCLELVSMDAAIRALPGDLSYLCAEGGTNFSLGQMQLLCIARALLREPGIVMMDEATANVDAMSDEIIQRTVRSHFKAATVLTIAHRLSTIADSVKIAVFEAGELAEYGKPQDLVKQGGLTAAFFAEAGVEIPSSNGEADLVDIDIAI